MKIRVIDLEFSYSSVPVLENICFEVSKSEIVSVIGPNGSGKSTLIKCIDRILKPNRGTVFIDEKDLRQFSQLEIAKKIGYIPQGAKYSFSATVFEVILMGRKPHITWRATERDIDRVVEVIKMLNLEEFSMRDINELSGGQQQRVFISRALAQEPEILLLDEPTNNLDIRVQLEVLDTIKEVVKKREMSAIMAMHDLNLASRYSDKIIMMRNGKIFAVGEPNQVLTPENIKSVYGVEVEVVKSNGFTFVLPIRPLRGNFN